MPNYTPPVSPKTRPLGMSNDAPPIPTPRLTYKPSAFVLDMLRIFKEEKDTDVMIEFEEGKFILAHSHICRGQSAYFNDGYKRSTMHRSGRRVIDLRELHLSFAMTKAVLQYMYSGEYGQYTSVPEERFKLHAEVYVAADRLGLEGLMNLATLKMEAAHKDL